MKVVDVYKTICGEGSRMGTPAIFVRLYGCNLNCKWCDERHKTYTEMSVEDLASKVLNLRGRHPYSIVVTGGEPMVQYEELKKFIETLLSWDDDIMEIIIETNGTFYDRLYELFLEFLPLYIITSPKKGTNINMRSLIEISELKFVVSDRDEGAWTLQDIELLLRKYNLNRERIWLMPITKNGVIDEELAVKVWDFCVENCLHYSDRLHIRVGRR